MDVDTASDNTSIDDKTEDFCENPTRDALTEGLMGLLKPTVDQLDERIRATRISQIELKQQIESLTEELLKISETLQCPHELDVYVKKLINTKHKVTVVNNILQTTQDRLGKIQLTVERSLIRQRAFLESTTFYDPAPTITAEQLARFGGPDKYLKE
ncbi:SNAPIN protein homolog [Neodiprion pinetum]|uniref:Biogenesis of lysosome-related organelles complex 1 subunit 7 n=1 Tax=Neodiprion lecontei TaxID=441921 RepID=A0A6J0B8N2_NEOLC|nr:SNAPIN protein homolog [Neodiprion lecontei]XP_046471790.1 SNAPIN protein homolog [Neodiprion pinetum]